MEVNKKSNVAQNRRNGICSNLKSLRMSNNTPKDVTLSSDYDTVKSSNSKKCASKDSPKSCLLKTKVHKKPNKDQIRINGIDSNLKSLRISNNTTKDVILSSDCDTSKDLHKAFSIKTKSCSVQLENIVNTTIISPKSESSMKLHGTNESEISGRRTLRNRSKPVSYV